MPSPFFRKPLVDPDFIDAPVTKVTAGFGGDVEQRLRDGRPYVTAEVLAEEVTDATADFAVRF
jgi:hypothetical protein